MKTLGVGIAIPSQPSIPELSLKKTSELPPIKKPWSFYEFLLNKSLITFN